jgi:hypothetical protein
MVMELCFDNMCEKFHTQGTYTSENYAQKYITGL